MFSNKRLLLVFSFFILISIDMYYSSGSVSEVSIIITTIPGGATIYVDGVHKGITPSGGSGRITVCCFDRGTIYRISASKSGYQEATAIIEKIQYLLNDFCYSRI